MVVHYGQRAPETAPVPSFPRGPPRKPKQSGHALWVGNLPPAATIINLKDHFSRNARHDIESLFLISKSNCAFVNYRSEAACLSAKNRFHDSNFHGVRLVCRLRRGSTSVTPTAITPEIPQIPTSPAIESPSESAPLQNGGEPVIVGHLLGRDKADPGSEIPSSNASSTTPTKEPAKYFIVKSLTVEDLEASVQNGIWATQSHNEQALSNAFDQAKNVFLIFSANKSGEFFGYARMTSQISGEPISLGKILENDEVGTPQSIPTLATATAPRGRIIDDSARGTIFWEAELSDEGEEDEGSPRKESAAGDDIQSSQNWGRQFEIVWMSTTRLPFFRTRGLRNPWNANREVKIARDGTELEPGIGLRLVQMFHRPIEAGLTAVAYS
nr:zinc finger ccch domain-containing protein 45 [Quercus suber]